MKSSPAAAAAVLLGAVLLAAPASAQPPAALKPPLAGLNFLVGSWGAGEGQVADGNGTSTGISTVTVEAGGAALLRRDHTELLDKAGKPMGGFDQIMLIYPQGGTLHADYSDGAHVIHYVSAAVEPGRAVTFTSAPGQGPVFKLTYEAKGANGLGVAFGMTPPGGAPFQPIATGTLARR